MKEFLICLGAIALFCIWFFLGAFIATWLWGLIIVPVFSLPRLGFWQMFGLIWLLKLLFGSNKIILRGDKKNNGKL